MNAENTVLLFATTTGYQIRVFEEEARRIGLNVVLATDRCHVLEDPWADRAIAVRFQSPAAYAKKLAGEERARGAKGIVAVGDRTTFLASLVAAELGIPYNSPAAVEAARNKYLARERFRTAGLNVPWYFRLPLDGDPAPAASHAAFPCVLKPLGLSASRGVIRANDQAEFISAFHRIRRLLESPEITAQRDEHNRFIQVEEYIPGREFAMEGLVTGGELQPLAIFDKPDPLEGPYFEETIYTTPSRESAAVQAELIETARAGLRALGLTQGPLHAEFRFNRKGAWILEMAARPIGGLCARALRFDGGMSLEQLILRHAIGEDVRGIRIAKGASGVMMIPIPGGGIYEGVEGEDEARGVRAIEDVVITAVQGQKLVPLPEGASYLGFLFARAGTPGEVERALREAHSRLRFRIATALPVFPAKL